MSGQKTEFETFIDADVEMSLAEYRKPHSPIEGHRSKSPAEIDEAINGSWL
jgi:hypothetical protein